MIVGVVTFVFGIFQTQKQLYFTVTIYKTIIKLCSCVVVNIIQQLIYRYKFNTYSYLSQKGIHINLFEVTIFLTPVIILLYCCYLTFFVLVI